MRVIPEADLSRLSGYGCPSRAETLAEVFSRDELIEALGRFSAQGSPVHIAGAGYNTLYGPSGVKGAVITLRGEFEEVKTEPSSIRAGAGASLGKILRVSARMGYSGLEFLAGIPGTAAGALVCNSGTAEKWIGGVLREAEVLREGRFLRIAAGDIPFSYRSSGFYPGDIITEAVFETVSGDPETVSRRISRLAEEKRKKHPAGGNCGCVFRNPENGKVSAGMLIRRSGLAGVSSGGARVSEKHCNFIVCRPGTPASDVWNLIKKIRVAVLESTGVELELELKLAGEGFD